MKELYLRQKVIDITNIAVKFQLMLCLLIAFFTMYGNSQMVSFNLYATFVVLIVIFLAMPKKENYSKSVSIDILLLLFIITLAFISISVPDIGSSISFTYFKKYIMFCSTLLFLYIVSKMKVPIELINYILKINYILAILYIAFYFFAERTYYGGGVTLNYSNPQLLALFLTHTVLYLIIALEYYKSSMLKIVSIAAICIIIYIIIDTKSRTSFGGLFFFLVLLFLSINRKKFKIQPLLIIISVLCPIIFVPIYFVQTRKISPGLLEFLDKPGKSLYSRMAIWEYALEVINKNPILGNYYEISDGTGMSQLHNTHIDTMASYGIIVFTVFIIYLCRIILRIARNCETHLQKTAIFSFLTIIILGSGEAALVSGSVGMYILTCSFLLIARYEKTINSLKA